MLALEVALAGADPVPTMVFDEVDAGVGGRAAVEIGRRLARLAARHQVVVVTHLPQVAAYADRHLLVDKARTGGGPARSRVRTPGRGRAVGELARMLAGSTTRTPGGRTPRSCSPRRGRTGKPTVGATVPNLPDGRAGGTGAAQRRYRREPPGSTGYAFARRRGRCPPTSVRRSHHRGEVSHAFFIALDHLGTNSARRSGSWRRGEHRLTGPGRGCERSPCGSPG